jgi:hypothetical protein
MFISDTSLYHCYIELQIYRGRLNKVIILEEIEVKIEYIEM